MSQVQVLVLSHGPLAAHLIATAEHIAGAAPQLSSLCLDWSATKEEAHHAVLSRIAELDTGAGVLVLADMYGDTPCLAALASCAESNSIVVTGANLPMVLRLCACIPDQPLEELAQWISQKGRASIGVRGSLEPAGTFS